MKNKRPNFTSGFQTFLKQDPFFKSDFFIFFCWNTECETYRTLFICGGQYMRLWHESLKQGVFIPDKNTDVWRPVTCSGSQWVSCRSGVWSFNCFWELNKFIKVFVPFNPNFSNCIDDWNKWYRTLNVKFYFPWFVSSRILPTAHIVKAAKFIC